MGLGEDMRTGTVRSIWLPEAKKAEPLCIAIGGQSWWRCQPVELEMRDGTVRFGVVVNIPDSESLVIGTFNGRRWLVPVWSIGAIRRWEVGRG